MLNETYPQDWQIRPLKELVRAFLNGGTPRTENPNYWDGSIPWITGADAEEKITLAARKNITELGVRESATNVVPKGNILLVTRTGVGKVSIAGVDVAISQDLTGLVVNPEVIDARYLYRQLFYRGSELQRLSQGSIIQGIERGEVEALELPVPCLIEQQKIAESLDTVDHLITLTDRHIAKLKQAKAGLLHDLLTRGIDEHGELRDPVAHPEQFKETRTAIDRIPKEWNVTDLLDVVPQIQYGISVSLDDESGIPVLRMNNLVNGEVDLSELKKSASPEAERLLLEPLDILFNRTNSIDHVGRTSIWRGQLKTASFASYLVRLLPDRSRLLPEYLNLWLNLPETQILIRRYATPGVHQVNINPTNLRKVIISLPQNTDEQALIIKKATTQNNLIQQKQRSLEKLRLLKKGLMADLLTGRVRVKLDTTKEG